MPTGLRGGGGNTTNTFFLENYGTTENPITISGMSGGEFRNTQTPATGKGYRVMYIINSHLKFENVTFTGGVANGVVMDGGGLYIEEGSTVKLLNGARITRNKTLGTGGGIYVKDATLTIDGAEISSNDVLGGGNGGGLCVEGKANVTIKSGLFTANTAEQRGGGIYLQGNADSSFIMTGGTISANSASDGYDGGSGGGIYISGTGKVEIKGGSIRYNMCNGNNNINTRSGGGGICSSGNWTLDGAEIKDNKAPNGNGGGVYVDNNKMTYISGTISGNTAKSNSYGHSVFRNNSLATVVGIDSLVSGTAENGDILGP